MATRRCRFGWAVCLIAGVFAVNPPAAHAQGDPNPGAITFTGGIDFLNAYYFRGIPQERDGLVTWPYGDLGFAVYSGDGGLKSVGVNVGTWNSLHTGPTGSQPEDGKLWYESDFYTTLGLGFGGGTSLGVTYTAYTSPNGLFGTVKELAFKLAVDDSGYLGGAAVRPYVLLARELDGQADGGPEGQEGTYLELGVAPSYTGAMVTVAVPVKVGLSLSDYYANALAEDEKFGFFSLAGVVTVPFTSMPTQFGTWNVHGGVEYLRLGDRNALLAGGEENNVVYSIGIGLSY